MGDGSGCRDRTTIPVSWADSGIPFPFDGNSVSKKRGREITEREILSCSTRTFPQRHGLSPLMQILKRCARSRWKSLEHRQSSHIPNPPCPFQQRTSPIRRVGNRSPTQGPKKGLQRSPPRHSRQFPAIERRRGPRGLAPARLYAQIAKTFPGASS